jgi:hypothetical protein
MLHRRRLLSVLPLGLAMASLARGGPARAGEDEGRKQVGQYVDLQPVALPVMVDGRLANYVFVTLRLNLASGVDTSKWRAKEPYFRDALVRMAHETAFNPPGETDKIDAGRLSAAMLRQATAIAGPGVVRSVAVTLQVSSRRPGAGHS